MENDREKATLVLTYKGDIQNYEAGLYHGMAGLVAVITKYGADTEYYAKGKEKECWDLAKLDKTLRTLTPPICLEEVGKVYVYAGAGCEARRALTLTEQLYSAGKDLTLVACHCGYGGKMETAKERGIPIIWTGVCSGYETLGAILDSLLGRIQGRNIQGL